MADLEKKRKRVNKNRKKNWRKHADISEVEEYLEDKRLEERTGGVAAEKTDEQLFFVDTKVLQKQDEAPALKKRKKEPKPLKCHANLEPDPKVKALRVVKNARTNNPKKICDRVRAKQEAGILSTTEKIAKEHRKVAKQKTWIKRKGRNVLPKANYDLWGDEAKEKLNDKDVPSADMDDDHYVKVTKRKRVKLPPRKTRSQLPAVEVAHPGASYNPTFDDHQELVTAAYHQESKKVKAEERVIRALDHAFPSRNSAPTEETYMKEMSAGLFNVEKDKHEGSSDEEDVDQDLDRLSVNPPVRREDKKTLQQKRKDKEAKQKIKNQEKERTEKSRKNELFRLKAIKSDLKARERLQMERAKKKQILQEKRQKQAHKLGALKFENPELEVKLSDEIEGSLRLLRPEGNLMEDRFKSLQKRNIIEPRKRANAIKKYKRKEFEKKGHKAVQA